MSPGPNPQDALSRQIAVFDFKGSVRITAASVLISGMGPLGVVTPRHSAPCPLDCGVCLTRADWGRKSPKIFASQV